MNVHLCYCGSPLRYRDSKFGGFWSCSNFPNCEGLVSANPDGTPKGEALTKAHRVARINAHAEFDRIWKSAIDSYKGKGNRTQKEITRMARNRCYTWLADKLGMTKDDCHMSLMSEEDCYRVVEACRGVEYPEIRTWFKANIKCEVQP